MYYQDSARAIQLGRFAPGWGVRGEEIVELVLFITQHKSPSFWSHEWNELKLETKSWLWSPLGSILLRWCLWWRTWGDAYDDGLEVMFIYLKGFWLRYEHSWACPLRSRADIRHVALIADDVALFTLCIWNLKRRLIYPWYAAIELTFVLPKRLHSFSCIKIPIWNFIATYLPSFCN